MAIDPEHDPSPQSGPVPGKDKSQWKQFWQRIHTHASEISATTNVLSCIGVLVAVIAFVYQVMSDATNSRVIAQQMRLAHSLLSTSENQLRAIADLRDLEREKGDT